MNKPLLILILIFHIPTLALSGSQSLALIQSIAQKATAPASHLKDLGPIISMGNSSLKDAQFIFLPEVHDNPDSQLVQLLLISSEKQKGQPFIVLDESLQALEKSSWEVFSQKTMEIVAATESQQAKERYSAHGFEASLQKLANKIQSNSDQLKYIHSGNIWVLKPFMDKATPFFGWDIPQVNSLLKRNLTMVSALKKAEKNNKRILIMLGARQVPELEYFTSKQLFCPGEQPQNIDDFFSSLEQSYGSSPQLEFGIGATAPIYQFLQDKKYVIMFSKKFFNVLNEIVDDFKRSLRGRCINL